MARQRFIRILTAAVLCLFAYVSPAAAGDHYASASGTSHGDGSLNNPWDLQTALNQPSNVLPGDTIWVRGGTYVAAISDGFTSHLSGTAASPIVLRNYNGERATIDGQANYMGLDVVGSYTWYWGLEVMSSCLKRTIVVITAYCAPGVGSFGPGNKFINMIVHDTAQGFAAYNAAPDNEFYGNLSYYNGFVGPDRNYGHGMYLQNSTGSKVVAENIIGDNADEGIQIYGSGNAALLNFTVSGNALYNTSSWPYPHYQYNLIIAGGQTRQNISIQNNFSYYPAGANAEGFAGQFGQYTIGQGMSITDNVFANGYAPVNVTDQAGSLTFTGNTVVASTDTLRPVTLDLWSGQSASYTWDNNTYFDQSGYHFFEGFASDGYSFSGGSQSFAGWQSLTGFDLHSSYTASAPTGVWTYVRPNQYEAKRANIVIFDWNSSPTAFVDLSKVLSPGDQYVIKDAENFYGPSVEQGVYSGNPVAISMTGLTKATPVGFAAPAHTAPALGLFVLLPVGTSQSVNTQTTGSQSSNSTTSSTTTSTSTSSTSTTSTPSTPATPIASATFAQMDTATSGNWLGTYAADGYSLSQGTQSLPKYATLAVTNASNWIWSPNATGTNALQNANASGRLATAWYQTSTVGLNINVNDGNSHAVSIYAVDFDAKGRSETIQVIDAATSIVLDSRSISNFTNGVYLTWNISGKVVIQVTTTAGPNAVVSGVFFGAPTPNLNQSAATTTPGTTQSNTGASASFVSSDTSTLGSWPGKYGADGYILAGYGSVSGGRSTPLYASIASQNEMNWTWMSATTDPRAVVTPNGASRIAAAWYNPSSFSIDLNLSDGKVHQVAFYAVDWDIKGRSETIQIIDANKDVLDTRSISNFSNGVYLTWNLSGHVTISITPNSSQTPANAAISAIFFGTGTPNSTPTSATFVKSDTSTQGNWQGVYGLDGFTIANATNFLPAYAAFGTGNSSAYTWTATGAETRDLQPGPAAPSSFRLATSWYGSSYSLDANSTDGNSHQLALYLLDWDSHGRSESIQITDASTGAVLDTRAASNFSQGVYYIWTISGHVKINVTSTAGPNAVISGAFFN